LALPRGWALPQGWAKPQGQRERGFARPARKLAQKAAMRPPLAIDQAFVRLPRARLPSRLQQWIEVRSIEV